MGWCERCGNYFILNTGRAVTRTIGARGRGPGITEVTDTVCPTCLKPDEEYDEYGVVIPKFLAEEMRRAEPYE